MLGSYAAILAMTHGFFELRQGNGLTGGISIHAIGPDCTADQIWHACFPAISLWPTFRLAGVFTILVSIGLLVLVLFFLQTKPARWLIPALVIGVLFCGGGFIATFTGLMAGGILFIEKNHCGSSPETKKWVSYLWLFLVVVYFGYAAGGWILGKFFNTFMVSFSGVLFVGMDILLPMLIILLAKLADNRIIS